MKFDPMSKTAYCPVCNTKRSVGDHSACSKKLQDAHKKPRKRLGKNTEADYMKSLDRYINPQGDL